MKDPNKVKMGKASRARGKKWEATVREELTKLGYVVTRFDNQVVMRGTPSASTIKNWNSNEGARLIQAKNKYNPFTKSYMATGGFPDFLCIKTTQTVKPLIFKFNGEDYSPEAILKFKEELKKAYNITDVLFYGGNLEHVEPPIMQLVECKTNNSLDRLEKEKCQWIEDNLKLPVFVAYPIKEGRKTILKMRRWNEVL